MDYSHFGCRAGGRGGAIAGRISSRARPKIVRFRMVRGGGPRSPGRSAAWTRPIAGRSRSRPRSAGRPRARPYPFIRKRPITHGVTRVRIRPATSCKFRIFSHNSLDKNGEWFKMTYGRDVAEVGGRPGAGPDPAQPPPSQSRRTTMTITAVTVSDPAVPAAMVPTQANHHDQHRRPRGQA